MLQAERELLLRSLADLDAEHAAGHLTQQQYDRLASTYTARAAAVLRTIGRHSTTAADAGTIEEPPTGPRRPRWRSAAAVALLGAAAVVAVLVLPTAVAPRQPGQTITGNSATAGEPTRDALARAVEAAPDDAQRRLAYARFLLDRGDLVDAIEHFDAAARLDPANPEALAYSGWILALAGTSPAATDLDSGGADLSSMGLERLDQAIATDPTYPDAHLFRGLTLLRTGHPAHAVTSLEDYLELEPDGPRTTEVEAALADARRQAADSGG